MGRWGAGAPGLRSAGMLVRWGGRAVGRRSGRSGWAFRQWGGGAAGRRGATAAERQNASAVGRQSSAAPECRYGGVPGQWGAGVLGRRSAGVVGCGGDGVRGWWCAGIVKCRGSGVVGCASNGAPECASNGVPQCRSGVFAGERFIKNESHIVFLGLFAAECLPRIVFCGSFTLAPSCASPPASRCRSGAPFGFGSIFSKTPPDCGVFLVLRAIFQKRGSSTPLRESRFHLVL